MVFIDEVAGFEIVVALTDDAIVDDAATDAGGKGEVKRATRGLAGFGEAGKVSVVVDEDGFGEIGGQLASDVEVFPGEIAEIDGAVVFDDARHGDGDDFDAG